MSDAEERFMCNSCNKQKAELQPRKSKITGMQIMICATCIDKGYEPRHLLIIGYNANSSEIVRKRAEQFIKRHLYVGETIALTEVL